ncbi:MAG: sortase [Salinibacterium sp.]|nr:sortase [Salinibacterium sp.]
MIARISAAVVMLLLLAGCSSTPAPQLAPSPAATPKPAPTAVVDVPVQSSTLTAPIPVIAPVRIRVPSVDIDISVGPVGVQDDGLMEIPSDIRTAGWYQYGPAPGSVNGSTVITAHVDSFEQGLGPFAYLKQLSAGADIIVTTADGADFGYVVESVQNVAKTQLPLGQVFDRVGAPRLVLITCGGQFDENVLNYSDNIIVIANPA